KALVVFGGYHPETMRPLHDGFALSLTRLPAIRWKALSPLPEATTTIGAAFLPSGHQHILLIGGFGEQGWIDRAVNGSQEVDPVKLGWQRTILAYNAVTDTWCGYGALAADDLPRCGAAAGLRSGKTPDAYTLILAGGERAPKSRTDRVTVAHFGKVAKFGAKAWLVVGAYACLMAGMACLFIFKKKDANDYFRGGNRIPWYVAGMSIFATMLSSITFIAIPTQTYLSDWRYFPMAICIFAIAPIAIYFYLPFFCRLNITSAYEYLEKRFNLGVRLFGSAAFVIFMVCRVAVVTLLPAIALNAVTGLSIDGCILICGILTMVYCSLGGLEAVIWSDFIQGIVLLGGALSVLIILVMRTGPEGAHLTAFWGIATTSGKTAFWDFRWVLSQPVLWVVLVQGIVSNLSSYTSDQCVIQRYIATPDERATRRSIWFNGVMSLFASVIFYGIGTALFTHYRSHPAMMDVTMPKSDSVFPIFMATELPWWLAGLVIAAIFAATISTLSANLSSASTALVTDFIKRFRPSISGQKQIRCGQLCTYAVGMLGILAALALARMESRALFDNFQEFIAMLTAGLTGLFFMGVFMPRVKGIAAVIGLLANYTVCFGCKAAGCRLFGHAFHPFLLGGIGLAVCIAVAWICSFAFREKGRDLTGLTLKTLRK
ncbi:MAG: sodium/solute symporter, partial [Kiritimatiellae bacterium]|nr:sodium/solute symporter [Kiritimatiellia bacterium]